MWAWGEQSSPPASSPAPPPPPNPGREPLIADYVLEEVKEDDDVPVEE